MIDAHSALERWGLVLLVASPAAFVPAALNRFTLPSVALAAAGAGMILAARPHWRTPRWLVLLLSAAALVLILSASLSATPLAAAFGRAPRFEGVFVLSAYGAALLAGTALAPLMDRRSRRELFLTCSAWTAIAVGCVAALQTAGADLLTTNVSREGSLLGNATSLGAFGVLLAPMLSLVAARDRKPLWVASAIAALACVVLSSSRSAFIGLFLAGVVVICTQRRRGAPRALAWMAAVLLAILALPSARDRLLGESPLAGATAGGRWQLWGQSLDMLRAHPFGVGPSGFAEAVVPYRSAQWYREVGATNPPDSPHNLLLQVASVGGVAALALMTVGAWLVWRRVAHRKVGRTTGGPGPDRELATGLAAGVLGYLAVAMFNFTEPVTTPITLFVGGLLIGAWPTHQPHRATSRQDEPALPPTWLKRTLAGWVLVTAGVLAVGALAEIPLKSAYEDVLAGRLLQADAHFRTSHALRPWDPDLAAQALHAFAARSAAGYPDRATLLSLSDHWQQQAGRWLGPDTRVLSDRAELAEYAEQPSRAVRLYQRVLSRDPNNPVILLKLGAALANSGDRAGAERAWLRSASIATTSPEPWTNLAALYDQQGRLDEAREARDKAATLR